MFRSMNDAELANDVLTLTNQQFAKVMGVSETRWYQLRAAKVIPNELLSPVPGRWSREKVARWLAEGSPAMRAKRIRRSGRAA